MGPECKCGCGEFLPEGSTREYKRGHRNRETTVTVESPEWDNYTDDAFTLDDAAASTEKDPPPDEPGKPPKYEAPLKITPAVRRDVEGKLAFMMTLTGSMWQAQDPVCGSVFLQQTPDIAAKLTPILCKSPDVVKWFRKSAGYMLYVDLLVAFLPVIQVVFAHHMASKASSNGQVDAQAPVYAS